MCNRKSQRYQIGVKGTFLSTQLFEKRSFSCCCFFAVRMSFPSWSLQSQMGESKLRKQQHCVSVGLLFFCVGRQVKASLLLGVSLPLLHLAAAAAAANNPRELVVTCCCLFSALLTGGEGEPRRGICLEISLPPTANWGGNASSFVFFPLSLLFFSPFQEEYTRLGIRQKIQLLKKTYRHAYCAHMIVLQKK